MQIVIGRIAGAEFREGTSKEGRPYSILNISVAVAEKSMFDGLPVKVSVPAEKTAEVRARILSAKFGDPFTAMVEQQTRSNGPDSLVFVDWFNFPTTPSK